MRINLTFKRTVDLSAEQRNQIRQLFYRVFESEMSEATFERRFMYAPKGYSYHGLMLSDDEIVGSFSAIPYRYLCFGKERLFALSVDTMIAPEHRGGKANLIAMANLAYEGMVKDGIEFIYGFPNELYYAHEKRILGTRDIGRLNYYVLPINFGTVVRKLKFLNYPSRLFARIVTSLRVSHNTTRCNYTIEKINDETFIRHRYDDSYTFLPLGKTAQCVYKLYLEEGGVRTLHILDIWPMSPAAMDEAILKIYRQYKSSVDLILYVGKLPFCPRRLVKVPQRLDPQKIRMTGKVLVKGVLPDLIFDIRHWNVNVSNFDVR
ncbi:MAG: GNAT family N-acetyltransferase [Sedimentisphaerales bacterium]|nr:GNAT family N-acetyltransferase [Sedimentisphaerales bacterium]